MKHTKESDKAPAVAVGSRIDVDWPCADGSVERCSGTIQSVEESYKKKQGSYFKYEIKFEDGDVFTTRLLHLNWSLSPASEEITVVGSKRKRKSERSSKDRKARSDGSPSFPTHQRIVAPMVGGSELAFRILCRRYGADLAYTPMMNSERFAVDKEYREAQFQTIPEDRPLVAHFSANSPSTLLAAAKHVESQCDAVDINLGCPQRVAFTGHFGSYLLGPEDREVVLSMVRELRAHLTIPVFVKIRLLDSVEETIELCRQLVEAGAYLIAIHGRYRVNLVGRTGPGARDGPAHLDQIKTIKEAIPEIPIIANGNVITWNDVVSNQESTGADGIMSAEGLLNDPTLFSPAVNNGAPIVKDKLDVSMEYLELADKYPVPIKSVLFHVRRISNEYLEKYQLMVDLLESDSVAAVQSVIRSAIEIRDKCIRDGVEFVPDSKRAARAADAVARRKKEEGKRKDYEARMVRKAKREGLADLNHYLNIGSQNPTVADITELSQMSKAEAFDVWKKKYSQHCFAFHFDSAKCVRERTCAFLHADALIGEAYG